MKTCPKCWKTYRLDVQACPHCKHALVSLTETSSVLEKHPRDKRSVSFDLDEIEKMPREESTDSFFPEVFYDALKHFFRVSLIVLLLIMGVLLFVWAVNLLV